VAKARRVGRVAGKNRNHFCQKISIIEHYNLQYVNTNFLLLRDISSGQNSNLNLNAVHFFNTNVN
jgi:hypothetical protein